MTSMASRDVIKQDFGRRLQSLMAAHGLRQSELARLAGLNRDAVSTYINGKVLPTRSSLIALADALKARPEDLLPSPDEASLRDDLPSLEIRASMTAPDIAWLKVNRQVRMATAVRVAELLQADAEFMAGAMEEKP